MEFATDQRNAKNYLENITILVFALFVLLFVWPIAAIVCGLVSFICRVGYSLTYKPQKVMARLPFFRLATAAQSSAVLIAIAACIYWQV